MRKKIIAIAALTGALGVIIGAFGAHAFKESLDPNQLDILRTGVMYMFIHSLAALVTGSLVSDAQYVGPIRIAGVLYIIGILLFAGSLILIATSGILGRDLSFLGMIAPVGGLCLIGGWLFLAYWAMFSRSVS